MLSGKDEPFIGRELAEEDDTSSSGGLLEGCMSLLLKLGASVRGSFLLLA